MEDLVAADDGLSKELLAALEVDESPQPVAARTRRRSGDAARPPGCGCPSNADFKSGMY